MSSWTPKKAPIRHLSSVRFVSPGSLPPVRSSVHLCNFNVSICPSIGLILVAGQARCPVERPKKHPSVIRSSVPPSPFTVSLVCSSVRLCDLMYMSVHLPIPSVLWPDLVAGQVFVHSEFRHLGHLGFIDVHLNDKKSLTKHPTSCGKHGTCQAIEATPRDHLVLLIGVVQYMQTEVTSSQHII